MEPPVPFPPFAGLLSWLAAGLVGAALTGGLLSRVRRGAPGWVVTPVLGLAGGLAGGLAATAVGFGGLGAFDAGAAVAAALAGALAVELAALVGRRRDRA